MLPRPRVLFLAPQPFFQWRGSPIRVGFNVQALAELGCEVDLLTLPIGEDRALPGVRVLRVGNPLRVRNIPIGPSAHKALFDLLILFRALALAFRRRYAAIHAVEETGLIGWLAARLTGAKAIFEKHSDPASHKDRPLKNLVLAAYRSVERLAVRAADAVIGTGEGLVAQAQAAAPGKPVHYIFDIPSSLVEPTPEGARAARARMAQAPGETLILYVGSFAVYQGLDLLFAAMPAVAAQCPDVRLIVIGGAEAEIAARRGWLRDRGIEDRVRFIGRVPPDALPDHLAAADILLSPRLSGINTPLKLLDYLKAARPVVATDNTANRQILDERCAVLTAPTPEAYAAGIAELARDPARRGALGRAGRQRIDERFNFGEFKRRLGACYRGLGLPLG